MKTGALITFEETRTLYPSATACLSICLSQPTYAQATVGKQFQQQQQQQL
jgi:hypothetical protein